jgi:predicted porin
MVPGVQAQVGSGVNVTADLESSFSIDDNKNLNRVSPGTTTNFETRLTFGIESETPRARVQLRTGGVLRFENAPDDDVSEFDDPFVIFSYGLDRPDSRLNASLRYRTNRITDTFLTDLDADFLEDDLVTDTGVVDSTSARLNYRFGIDSPIGGSFTIQRSERDYTGTTNPDLFDRTSDSARVEGIFRINPVATARIIGTWGEYTADDIELTTRDSSSVGAGLSYEFSPAMRFDGEIRSNEIETVETIGFARITRNNTATSGFGRLTRDLPNGTISGSIATEVNSLTSRTTVRADRTMETPGALFNIGVGVSESDTGDTSVIGSLDYVRELSTGILTAGLDQSAVANLEDEEVLRTQFSIAYLHELTPSSGLDVGFELARTDDIGLGDANEQTRTEFTLNYRRELTEDWDWTIGYRGRQSRQPGVDTATSNAILTTISRSFSLRP